MKRKVLAVAIATTMMLTACNSKKSGSDDNNSGQTWTRDGDYIVFGHYEQDGDESNGPEPIQWKILSEEDDRIFLVSRNILDYQAYNTELTDVTWETCSLRVWLNDDFYNAAFDASEQEQILTVTNTNPDNEIYWGTDGGNDTEDKIFLLSIDEAQTLFVDDDDRACGPCEWWWLRSPGNSHTHAAVCLGMGEMLTRGHLVSFNYFDHGVRPALWLDLSGDGSDET